MTDRLIDNSNNCCLETGFQQCSIGKLIPQAPNVRILQPVNTHIAKQNNPDVAPKLATHTATQPQGMPLLNDTLYVRGFLTPAQTPHV